MLTHLPNLWRFLMFSLFPGQNYSQYVLAISCVYAQRSMQIGWLILSTAAAIIRPLVRAHSPVWHVGSTAQVGMKEVRLSVVLGLSCFICQSECENQTG